MTSLSNNHNRLLSNFMKPNRNDLFYPFEQVFDKFFNDLYSDLSPNSLKAKSGFPRWDIYQTEDEWVVEIAATGCEPDDVTVEILPTENSNYNRMLKISGRVAESFQLGDQVAYSVRELRRSSFERFVYLPNDITGDPKATMKNGILKLAWDLPLAKKKLEAKKIEIKKLDK